MPLANEVMPSPQPGTMVWDKDHVRMPCDSNCQYVEIDTSGNKILRSRWVLIKELLLEKPIQSSYELESVIKSYNMKHKTFWDFSTLHELFQVHYQSEKTKEFFSIILPNIINLALELPKIIQSPIPLLKEGMNRSISMSQQQAASLLANAFLCTFPYRNNEKKNLEFSNYPEINFNRLFGCRGQNIIEKLKCVFNYFERFFRSKIFNVITFQRISNNGYQWQNCEFPLYSTKFHISSTGKIEDSPGMIQVDFANRFIGGGVLSHGAVQEEIRFLMSPEMIVAKLFTESLSDNETLLMIGCEQFNKYTGYASNFKFDGDFFDQTPFDSHRRRKTRVVAIDALFYKNFYDQFKEQTIRRELNKAYVGFKGYEKSPIATGLWGCGAFNGYTIRSALIQLMACTVIQKYLVFYTFGNELVKNEIADIFMFLCQNNVTVEQLYKVLLRYRYDGDPNDPTKLVMFIKKEIENKN